MTILFISHDASRTGAPILLLNLIEWLVLHKPKLKLEILLVKGGELEAEFKNLATTYVFENSLRIKNTYLLKIFNILSKAYFKYFFFKKTRDVIFSNTIVNGAMLRKFKKNETPIISYVHELEKSIQLFINRGMALDSLKLSNYFLCGSEMVKETLIQNFDIPNEKASVVRSFIDFKKGSYEKNKEENTKIREELGIKNDFLVVGMMGSQIERKGPDLFVKTALKLQNKKIHFVWIGAKSPKTMLPKLKTEQKLNLTVLPSTDQYSKYFQIFDVFFLSSREDPYPMVMVEASAFGIPIICFENAGGTQEFIDEKVGFIAPYEDTDYVSNCIEEIIENKDYYNRNKKYIQKKSYTYHDIYVNAQNIVLEIDKVLKKF